MFRTCGFLFTVEMTVRLFKCAKLVLVVGGAKVSGERSGQHRRRVGGIGGTLGGCGGSGAAVAEPRERAQRRVEDAVSLCTAPAVLRVYSCYSVRSLDFNKDGFLLR